MTSPTLDRSTWSHKTRNLVRFCRHLPEETLDASFAGDFAFRDHGSRFMFLKNVGSAPGPDDTWGIFARDGRPVFDKLLGLRLQYRGLSAEQRGKLGYYNSMNYYRSHIHEFFCHNGIEPAPPVLGECEMWYPAADRLHIRYRLRNQSPTPVPLRLQWFTQPTAGARVTSREGTCEIARESTLNKVDYTARARLFPGSPDQHLLPGGDGAASPWSEVELPAAGELVYDMAICFTFDDQPWPELPTAWRQATVAESVRHHDALWERLPELTASRHEAVVLKAAGGLRTLRYRDYNIHGEPTPTIHAGKTGCAATWFWDTAFALLGLAIAGDRESAFGAMSILTDGIKADGTPCVTYEAAHYLHGYQLPILAWGCGHFLAHHPTPRMLERVYEPLARYVRNWEQFRQPSGLAVYPRGGTSLDDALRWHTGFPLSPRPGTDWWAQAWGRPAQFRFESPDVNAFLYLEMRTLAGMAEALGKDAEAERWRTDAATLAEAINARLLDPETGIYLDRYLDDDRFNDMVNLGSFIPIYAGLAPPQIAEQACRRYLLSDKHFLTPFPFPVVDRAHPTFRHGGVLYEPPSHPGALVQQAYWRGRTWIHGNYWYLGAMVRAGLTAEADAIADQMLEAISRNEGIAECYDSLTGYPNGHNEFMWSSAAVLTLAYRHYHRAPIATLEPTT